ncbi:MAG: FecR domain-containing protein [Acidobacteriia bacterium]|nr:FecR domain-containing protein [Terriglobia bacterium]
MMKMQRLFLLCLPLSALLFAAAPPVDASPSQARIVRLSFVQGEVSFTRSATSDPLAGQNIAWEAAVANLPIRQGYVLATLQGRAEVEFESGAVAFLAENSVLEFFDLSLDDGARITRLVLRQGTASFSVQPARGDFFSVTGADFTAEPAGRGLFRMENFDDGSTIAVRKGRVKIVAKSLTSELNSGESLAFGPDATAIPPAGQLPAKDEFDAWVSYRADAANTAAASSLTYVSSPYYSSGFADLYSYGGWFSYAGYGYCWRPSGVGLGWSPFTTGNWFFDPFMGWTWVSYEPWGWVPYHFGSWIFDPSYGWIWVPSGFSGWGAPAWRPSTAVWVHSGGTTGIVPLHPLDRRGKSPLNLSQGVIGTAGVPIHSVGQSSSNARAAWKVLKSPQQDALAPAITRGIPPVRVSRTLAATGAVQGSQGSSIQYDSKERKFVNANTAVPGSPANPDSVPAAASAQPVAPASVRSEVAPAAVNARTTEAAPRVDSAAATPRSSRATPPPPAPLRTYTPPPPPRASSATSTGNHSQPAPARSNSGADRSSRSGGSSSGAARESGAGRSASAPRPSQSSPPSHPH